MRLVGARRAPARRRRRSAPRSAGAIDALGQAREARLGERDQRVMIDLAGRDQDQAAGAIMVGPPGVRGRRP